ncbi:hypothetical protein IFM89_004432 [Coptis chinensis]|uniref:Uncharacterized protein n=1 Tax=Coptis chinensis TaxID=261450 RepID=A0A835GU41_9MAGN|nr:hypothetical protein IFM89_004432 [Coptis chinensis]
MIQSLLPGSPITPTTMKSKRLIQEHQQEHDHPRKRNNITEGDQQVQMNEEKVINVVEDQEEEVVVVTHESTGLRLLGLLLQCAESVAMESLNDATSLLPEISELSSPFGSSIERVGAYFVEALRARIVSSFLGVGSSYELLEATGKRLTDFASSFDLPFEYVPLEGKIGNISDLSQLAPRPNEATVVHWMHHCLYDITGSDLGTLKLLNILKPKLITIVEQDLSNGGNFLGRFVEALHYYSALFDALGDGQEWDSMERYQVEQHIFGSEIKNIVAVGGPKRTGEVKVERWGEELRRIGFNPVSLGGNPAAQASLLLDHAHVRAVCKPWRSMHRVRPMKQLPWLITFNYNSWSSCNLFDPVYQKTYNIYINNEHLQGKEVKDSVVHYSGTLGTYSVAQQAWNNVFQKPKLLEMVGSGNSPQHPYLVESDGDILYVRMVLSQDGINMYDVNKLDRSQMIWNSISAPDNQILFIGNWDASLIATFAGEIIKAIIEDDPASVNLDLDHDPVAQDHGPDKFGQLLGMSVGISKTALASSAPAKEQLCQQKQQHSMLKSGLEVWYHKWSPFTKILLETREEVAGQQSHRRMVADSSAPSNVRDPTRSQSHGDSSIGMELCELINMYKKLLPREGQQGQISFLMQLDTPMDIYNPCMPCH